MLWSIFITYIITHHGLGGFSGLINGLIAAAIGALSMLMSEPTAKSYVKKTCMFVLSIATFTFTFTFRCRCRRLRRCSNWLYCFNPPIVATSLQSMLRCLVYTRTSHKLRFSDPSPPPSLAAAGKKKRKKIGFRKWSPEWVFLKTLAYRFRIR